MRCQTFGRDLPRLPKHRENASVSLKKKLVAPAQPAATNGSCRHGYCSLAFHAKKARAAAVPVATQRDFGRYPSVQNNFL